MVKVVETVLRDGHQSIAATRLTTNEILDAVQFLDKAGYHALEVWGGATFDSCVRFLKEDPWERLRQIKKIAKNTKLQMLLRGQNLLGYRHYSDEIVEKFIKKSLENGIDIIRVFDALNDLRNLETSIKAIKKYGGHCQVALSYTVSPVHTISYYVQLAKEVEELGADSICIKDMAGIMLPEDGYKLIKELKNNTKLLIELHTHQTAGIGDMLYLRAIDAGVDIIDTALSPFGGGTSQPVTESMCYVLKDTDNDLKLNFEMLNEALNVLNEAKNRLVEENVINPQTMFTNPNILTYQVPGGMLSNLLSQLKDQKALHLYEDVLKEIPKVRADLGYPPLVTPLSQMVGTQAVMNVLTNQRYKMVPSEIKEYVKGNYGSAPQKIADDIVKLIIGDEKVNTARPADLLTETLEDIRKECEDLENVKTEEDLLTYAMFPQVAREFFQNTSDEVIEINVQI